MRQTSEEFDHSADREAEEKEEGDECEVAPHEECRSSSTTRSAHCRQRFLSSYPLPLSLPVVHSLLYLPACFPNFVMKLRSNWPSVTDGPVDFELSDSLGLAPF